MFKLTSFNSPVNKENSLFDTFFDDFFDFATPQSKGFKLDVRQEENKYIVEADMPGVKKENIKINYENDHILIKVERKEEKEEKDKTYIHKERSISSMQRAVYMPDVDPNEIKAKLSDGVLKLTIKKEDKKENKHFIEIE